MKRFTSIEQVEEAFASATTREEVGEILGVAQRQRKLLGDRHTASDPTSNRRRIVAALNAAVARFRDLRVQDEVPYG